MTNHKVLAKIKKINNVEYYYNLYIKGLISADEYKKFTGEKEIQKTLQQD